MDSCNTYAYPHSGANYGLEGIRQYLKMWHAVSIVEQYRGDTFPTVLDIGCGYGHIKSALDANGIRHKYCGLDAPTAMHPGADIEVDLTEQRIIDVIHSQFDFIFLYDLLQNISKDAGVQVIEDLKNVAAPNAIVSICTRNGLMEAETDADHHVHRWDIKELGHYLRSNGIEIHELFGLNFGMDSGIVSSRTKIDRFLPSRFVRAIYGIEAPTGWANCKFVMIDGMVK